MPAPLAKGLIIAASVLVAAGIAVYENPQVQEWVERTRRKITTAIYNLGEDAHRAPSHDEKVAVAVEAARRKRDEVLATSRELFTRQHEKRGDAQADSKAPLGGTQASFDDFLQRDTTGTYTLYSSAVEPATAGQAPRRRVHNDQGLDDSKQPPPAYQDNSRPARLVDVSDSNDVQEESLTRDSSATLSAAHGDPAHVHPSPDSEPLIRIHSESPSEASSFVAAATPTSPAASVRSLQAEAEMPSHHQPPTTSTYFSVNEWAEQISPAFNGTSPRNASPSLLDQDPPVQAPHHHSTEHTSSTLPSSSSASSLFGSVDFIRENESVGGSHGEDRYSDIISQTSGMRTPATWTEVGSEVSDGDIGGQ